MGKPTLHDLTYRAGDADARAKALGRHDVPPPAALRRRLAAAAAAYVARRRLVPPLSWEEVRAHSLAAMKLADVDAAQRDYLTVLLNNEVWRETFAAVPFARRTLLLPPCLRPRRSCPAGFDEFGLLCQECGRCVIGPLQAEAEALGYAVLVAEGTSIVRALLERGLVDAVLGVSCMASLERAFPYMTSHAVPGIAVPLLADGCNETAVDVEEVRRALRLAPRGEGTRRLDLEALRRQVESWFDRPALRTALGGEDGPTRRRCVSWLAKAGKRWRPFLASAVHAALTGCNGQAAREPIRTVAMAVECFHKASLIHDDIEDGDGFRYGEQTLHRACGVPAALHAGDFLIFEGYRLIGECGAEPRKIAAMLRVAAGGHRGLCLGQGRELSWAARPGPLSVGGVLDIFRLKTAPAFDVALRLGALCGGADEATGKVLTAYSRAVGVAYQIRDDLNDFLDADGGDLEARRPSLLLALAWEGADPPGRRLLRSAWRGGDGRRKARNLRRLVADLGVEGKARRLLKAYQAKAIRSLRPLRNVELKMLLYRVVGRMFDGQQETNSPQRRRGHSAAFARNQRNSRELREPREQIVAAFKETGR